VATLALGIGANTAIFSAVDACSSGRCPTPTPTASSWCGRTTRRRASRATPRRRATIRTGSGCSESFTDIAATRGASGSVTSDGLPEQLLGRRVSQNFFGVLGVRPAIGRAFTEDEDRVSAPVIVISDGLGRRRYGSDRAILGRTILMNDNRYQIIGVMPPGFVFRDRDVDYWAPIDLTPAGRRRSLARISSTSSRGWRRASPWRRQTTTCGAWRKPCSASFPTRTPTSARWWCRSGTTCLATPASSCWC